MGTIFNPAIQAPARPGVSLPVRWVCSACAVSGLPLVLLMTTPIAPQNGWWWDILMAAGMIGAGAMIAIPLLSSRVWVHYGGDPAGLRFLLQLHRDVSYATLTLIAVHIVGLLLVDPTLVQYLKLSAPWSMLAAIVATIGLVVIALSSIYRIASGVRYRTWRRWHVGISVAAMGLMIFHVIDAGYYINTPLKKIAFVVLASAPSLVAFGASGWHRLVQQRRHEKNTTVTLPVLLPNERQFSVRLVSLMVVLYLVSVTHFAIPKPNSRAFEQANPCPAAICD